jgi:hypothetical protein
MIYDLNVVIAMVGCFRIFRIITIIVLIIIMGTQCLSKMFSTTTPKLVGSWSGRRSWKCTTYIRLQDHREEKKERKKKRIMRRRKR